MMSRAVLAGALVRIAIATALQALGWMLTFSQESPWPLLLTLAAFGAILTPMSLGRPRRSWIVAWGDAMGITLLGWLLGGGLFVLVSAHECPSHSSLCLH